MYISTTIIPPENTSPMVKKSQEVLALANFIPTRIEKINNIIEKYIGWKPRQMKAKFNSNKNSISEGIGYTPPLDMLSVTSSGCCSK